MIKDDEGYGYEWDAMLMGGPADGCMDIAIKINGDKPPKILKRIVDGSEMERETLGEKLIEYFTDDHMDGNQRVAVYRFRQIDDNNEKCLYDYVETIRMNEFRLKYEVP